MGKDVLHGATVGQGALTVLPVGLLLPLPPLTLVGVEQENQLLLDQLPLVRVSGWVPLAPLAPQRLVLKMGREERGGVGESWSWILRLC